MVMAGSQVQLFMHQEILEARNSLEENGVNE